MNTHGTARGRVARRAGCLAVGAGLTCLAAAALLWLFGVVVDREDWSDIRFFPLVYTGRWCKALQIEGQPYDDAVVTITNTGTHAVRELRITIKYFIGDGPEYRPVVEHYHEALAGGESVSFGPPERDDIAFLGMIYVLVKSDHGYAVHRAWYSFWS